MSKRVKGTNGSDLLEDEERANGDSSACSHTYTQHRRAMSTTEKSLDLPRAGISYCRRKCLNESPEFVPSTSGSGASPLPKSSLSIKKDGFSNQRAYLENDIEQLQMHLQQEKSMRAVLEKAMGRASSTLSPGHRHFAAQTEVLIAEIELLEEEVAKREQHVLSLYRSIFEHCVSRPASEHSSAVASPAQALTDSRKHPSIIASAFCSSKKFPLRNLHSLGAVNDSGKKSLFQNRTRQASSLDSNENMHFEKNCAGHVKARITSKTSVPRTLNDHLHQCPSKLTEEMLRCTAAVYCWLQNTSSAEQSIFPPSSKSSTDAIFQRRKAGEEKDWSTNSTVEMPCIPADKNNFSRASYAISNYRAAGEGEYPQDGYQCSDSILDQPAYLAFGIPHNSLRRLALFHKAAYNVGGYVISADIIEKTIFGYRTPRTGPWLETVLSAAMRKRSGQETKELGSKYALQDSEPLVCFALCTGAYSDPLLNVYTAANIKRELEAAKKEFLQANATVKDAKKIVLPKLVERYAKEAGIPSDDILNLVAENVDKELHDSVLKCQDGQPNKRPSQCIKWLPYNSRFRYTFSKELTREAMVGVDVP